MKKSRLARFFRIKRLSIIAYRVCIEYMGVGMIYLWSINGDLSGGIIMAKSIYLDKGIQPDELMLTATLGEQKSSWDDMLRYTTEEYALVSCEWKYYGIAWGWSFVIKSKAKTLCYLIPTEGHFYVAIIFNDKGRAIASDAELSAQVKQALEATKDNPKNIPYDYPVMGKDDVVIAKRLIMIRSKT